MRPTRNRQRSYGLIAGHLMGEYSLARSYWLHSVLLTWGTNGLFAWVVSCIGELHQMRFVSMAVIAYLPIAVLISMWATFGTTVSALKHLFSGKGWFWAALALISMVAGTFGLFKQAPAMAGALREHWAVAGGEQPGDPFTVTLTDDGRVVEFTGGVNDGAAAALEAVVGPAPKVTTVRLASPGGWLSEGERMAAVVKRFRLNTTVRRDCISSCTVVFLAGLDRTAEAGAVIGFHRGRAVGGMQPATAPAPQEEADIYRRAGAAEGLVQRIMNTPNETVWVPTRKELLAAGVLTR